MQRYFFRYLLGLLCNLAHFQSNIKVVKEIFRETLLIFAGKTSIFIEAAATIWREQIVYVSQCGEPIRKSVIARKLLKIAKFIIFPVGRKKVNAEGLKPKKLELLLACTGIFV